MIASLPGAVARAQRTVEIERSDAPFYGVVGGPRLGHLTAGVQFAAGTARQDHTLITLDGWVFRTSLQRANRNGHTLAVSGAPVENLRDGPNGAVLARMVRGFLLDEVERRGQWVRVRRTVWVRSAALRSGGRPTAAAPAPQRSAPRTEQAAPAALAAQPPDVRRAVVRRRAQLYRAPDSTAIGTLEAGQPVRVTARAGNWLRVETQAWVRENEVRPSNAAILTGLSAAELRGAPDEYKGKLLRWTIQYLSLQTADELRPDFTPGQRYILARGPAPEYAFVYIIVPPERLVDVQKLEPLASVQVVARVVSGRSMYLANPILELVELP